MFWGFWPWGVGVNVNCLSLQDLSCDEPVTCAASVGQHGRCEINRQLLFSMRRPLCPPDGGRSPAAALSVIAHSNISR